VIYDRLIKLSKEGLIRLIRDKEKQIDIAKKRIESMDRVGGGIQLLQNKQLLGEFRLHCKFIIEDNIFHFLEEILPFSDNHEWYKKVSRDYIKNAVREISEIIISMDSELQLAEDDDYGDGERIERGK